MQPRLLFPGFFAAMFLLKWQREADGKAFFALDIEAAPAALRIVADLTKPESIGQTQFLLVQRYLSPAGTVILYFQTDVRPVEHECDHEKIGVPVFHAVRQQFRKRGAEKRCGLDRDTCLRLDL